MSKVFHNTIELVKQYFSITQKDYFQEEVVVATTRHKV